MIAQSLDTLERFTGEQPVGWLGPGLTQTEETPELLAAAGIKYIGDWVYDDEPTEIRTAQRPAGHPALFGRAQRHPDDAGAAPRIGLFHAALHRQLRPALSGGRGAGQDHGDRDPPLHQRPAAPDQIPRSRLRPRQPLRRRIALERGRDPRLVLVEDARGQVVMLPTERLDYSAITERPPLVLPGGARMAVWIIVNVEEWDPQRDDAAHRDHAAGRRRADARHPELGLARIWQPGRLLADAGGVRRRSDPRGAQRSTARRSRAMRRSSRPRVERGWEFIGHGFSQKNMQKVADERDDIRKTAAAIRAVHGARTRAAGSAPALPRPGRRRTCWPRRATTMSATGCSTTSRCC